MLEEGSDIVKYIVAWFDINQQAGHEKLLRKLNCSCLSIQLTSADVAEGILAVVHIVYCICLLSTQILGKKTARHLSYSIKTTACIK